MKKPLALLALTTTVLVLSSCAPSPVELTPTIPVVGVGLNENVELSAIPEWTTIEPSVFGEAEFTDIKKLAGEQDGIEVPQSYSISFNECQADYRIVMLSDQTGIVSENQAFLSTDFLYKLAEQTGLKPNITGEAEVDVKTEDGSTLGFFQVEYVETIAASVLVEENSQNFDEQTNYVKVAARHFTNLFDNPYSALIDEGSDKKQQGYPVAEVSLKCSTAEAVQANWSTVFENANLIYSAKK